MAQGSLLDRLLGPCPPPFALLYRPVSGFRDHIDVLLVGDITTVASPAGIPLPAPSAAADGGEGTIRHDVLVLAPPGQDGAGLLALTVTGRAVLPLLALGAHGALPGLDVFRRLAENGRGAYWTYLIHTGDRTLVGTGVAPHLTLRAGAAVLHRLGGTYRATGEDPPGRAGMLGPLADRADTDRARLALDEGLMALARLCLDGVRVRGPWLRETATAARTEYAVEGRCHRDPRELLDAALPAPGFAALIGRDRHGAAAIDSTVLTPGAESTARTGGLAAHPRVRAELEARNSALAGFWFGDRDGLPHRGLAGRRALVIDAGDGFTPMLVHQFTALGLDPTVRRLDEPHRTTGYDLLVLAGGHGDPRLTSSPGIARLRDTAGHRLAERRPLFAVGLGHQVTAGLLGLGLFRRGTPRRGLQRTIELDGRREQVGFHDTFAVRGGSDRFVVPELDRPVEADRDPLTGEVYALRGTFFASVQFRPESVLTRHGVRIMGSLIQDLLRGSGPAAGSGAPRSA
ncbi:phenazine-specific anthranilate synthase component I [Streptomyces sp. NPDC002928]|uniref:glutamine amidotransferase-related protein n=1 Tax=Streptomyces sp. NPDC002928 TaxID=3154440 RepID=UPI0033A0F98E